MPTTSPTTVFISYARKDGTGLAHRLFDDLRRQGFSVWLDTREIAIGATWTREIERALDSSDVVLALLTSGSYVSEICRAEQLRALRYQKCVIPLKVEAGLEVMPLHFETKNYLDFSASYDVSLAALLNDIGARKGVALNEAFRNTYVTAPPLPANYVVRSQELTTLRNAIITEGRGRNIAVTSLEGMGGIGKSVLAAALCHDEVVQQAFPDGVIWVVAGRESTYDLITRMREVAKGLGDDLSRYDSELACKHQYRNTMRNKAALVVVDDVWDVRDIEAFRAESPRSHLLFTTRRPDIAAALGAHQHQVGLLTEDESRQLLASGCGIAVDQLPKEAGALIHESGKLPLAVGMIGAMLRHKAPSSSGRVLEHLRRADLGRIKAKFPDYPYDNLLRAIQVSVDALAPTERQRYLALAVLLEDMPVYPAVQQALWSVEASEAEETAELFMDLSLAQRVEEGFRLHDLQLDYVRAQCPEPEGLAFIHGALRLSAHVIAKDPLQFASQITGRLLSHQDQQVIRQLLATLIKSAPIPWLHLLHPTLRPPGTAFVLTLGGHSGYTLCAAINPEAQLLVSGSRDTTLRFWNSTTGVDLHTIKRHTDDVLDVAISSDGRLAVSASKDRTLRVWDSATGLELHTLKGHSDHVLGVAISPDGRLAVSASRDTTLKVWDLTTGLHIRSLEGHSNSVQAVAIIWNGERAVSASSDRTLKVWNLKSGMELYTLRGHADEVYAVAVSPDGRTAASASKDNTLKRWDIESGHELQTLQPSAEFIYCAAISADTRRALFVCSDHSVRVWNLETDRELRILESYTSHIVSLALSPEGRYAVSAFRDKTLMVWDLDSGREFYKPTGHTAYVLGVAADWRGQRAVTASWDGTLGVWNVDTGDRIGTLEGHSSIVREVAISPDGLYAVSASADKTLRVWNLESGREVRSLEGHSGDVYGVAITTDGQRVVSASRDKTVKVWNLESGRELYTLIGHSAIVQGVAISRNDAQVLSASSDHTLKVWDLALGLELRTLRGHTDDVYAVATAPDGRVAVSASRDCTLKVWDVQSGLELRTLAGHSDFVYDVTISKNGKYVASASADQTLRLWSLYTGRSMATFTFDTSCLCCAFINDLTIAAGDSMGQVHFLSILGMDR